MLATIGIRTRVGVDNYLWVEREVGIISALNMLDELEARIAAPLREILRWFCDREFPVPAYIVASFATNHHLVRVEHVIDDGDIPQVTVSVGLENQPEEIEIRIPSEAVKEL